MNEDPDHFSVDVSYVDPSDYWDWLAAQDEARAERERQRIEAEIDDLPAWKRDDEPY